MGRIGYGYGSECHLLRYLGRHRRLFEERILTEIGSDAVNWLDFHFDCAAKWKDAEWKGLEFLRDNVSVQAAWSEFWPQRGGIHNWDTVGRIMVAGEEDWLLVKAKANIEELQSTCRAEPGRKGYRQISESLAEVKAALGVPEHHDWLRGYYQFANRVAALYFLNSHGVGARLLLIYFTGDQVQGRTCPQNESEWIPALEAQDKAIGLPGGHALSNRIHKLFLPVCLDEQE